MTALSAAARERVLGVARRAEPPPIDPERADALLRHAMATRSRGAGDDARSSPPRAGGRRIALAIAGAAAIAAAGWLGHSVAGDGAANEATGGSPLTMTLPTGDRLTATGGARFVIRELGLVRVIAVDEGTVLADVVPLVDGERFAIDTPHGRVEVRGTVFSVEVRGDRTVVRVYEGRVRVVTGDRERALIAGQRVTMDGRAFDVDAPAAAEALRRAADEAVRAREAPATEAPDVVVSVPARDAPVRVDVPRGLGAHPAPMRDPGARDPAAPAAAPALERPPRPAYARRWILDGQPERALSAADLASRQGRHGPTWQMVRGDALAAMGRHAEAIDAYEAAALGFGPGLAARACFAAASTRWHHLHDATGALRSLERLRCLEGDPLATRQSRALYDRLVQATQDSRRGRALGDP